MVIGDGPHPLREAIREAAIAAMNTRIVADAQPIDRQAMDEADTKLFALIDQVPIVFAVAESKEGE